MTQQYDTRELAFQYVSRNKQNLTEVEFLQKVKEAEAIFEDLLKKKRPALKDTL